MKKAITLEIWVDEKLSNAAECVNDVYHHALSHEYISDGSVDIKVVAVDEI